MSSREFMSVARDFIARRPALGQAVAWSLPAIFFGLILRAVLMRYQPFAYWGSDSESYFSFTYRMLSEHVLSLPEKRRYVFPLVLFPISILPGSPLRWLAFFQHAMGLVTVIPLAYAVRKIFDGWKLWIIPITSIYAGMPIILWYEHELLGEAFFFATLVWIVAAWVAWVARIKKGDRAEKIWWIFFTLLALCTLTKPAARFFWPGLAIGLIYIRSWRFLRWPQWTAIGALFLAMLTMGEKSQASRLLYSSAFPLTVLGSPENAELKAEIAPMVRLNWERLDYYYAEDDDAKDFLRGGYRSGPYPAWQALEKKGAGEISRAMKSLALEAISAHPVEFLYIGLQRAVSSINWTMFKLERFKPGYFAQELAPDWAAYQAKGSYKKMNMVQFALGLPDDHQMAFPEIKSALALDGRENCANWMNSYVRNATSVGVFVAEPTADGFERTLRQMMPTLLGKWLVLGCLLSVGVPAFRSTLGIWIIIAAGYAVAVHLVGSANPRFFAAAWPPFILAMAVPLDTAWRLTREMLARYQSKRRSTPGRTTRPHRTPVS